MIEKKRLLSLVFGIVAPLVGAADAPQSPEALRRLAERYEHARDGVRQDYAEAYRLYCQAYWQGDAPSAYALGFMHFNGRGRPRNLAQALFWFHRAAERGDSLARRMTLLYRDVLPEEDPACKPPAPPSIQASGGTARALVERWVSQIAPYYSIDPQLVMAVIQVESGFDAGALSPKHAQGLMQLIPATAERFGVKDVWDPIDNIRGGIAYLNWLMRHFAGNVEWVLAAYNAGEGAVERYHGIPPYEETQVYVRRILAQYRKTAHPIPPPLPENAVAFPLANGRRPA